MSAWVDGVNQYISSLQKTKGNIHFSLVTFNTEQLQCRSNCFFNRPSFGFSRIHHMPLPLSFSTGLLRIIPILLGDTQNVIDEPIQHKSGRKIDKHNSENHRHQHHHFLLNRVSRCHGCHPLRMTRTRT